MIDNVVYLDDVVGHRMDPHQFHPERVAIIERIKKQSWCKLKDVIKNVKTTTSSVPKGETYIGLENIESNTGIYTPSDIEAISTAAKFKKGDVLFPKLRPYLNKVHLAQFDGYCSTEFMVFEARNILPEYLTIILRSNVVLAQTKHLMTGNTHPRLQPEDVEDLILPYPPVKVQRYVIKKFIDTIDKRNENNRLANEIITNIDNYLLEKLQIDSVYSSEKNSFFHISFSELIASRMDVSFYKDKFEMISQKYNNTVLSSIVEIDPTITFKGKNANETISFIPMESIDEMYGEIIDLRETTVMKSKGYTKFEENDLLWAKITPCMQNGKSAIARGLKNGAGCGSTEFFVIRPKNDNRILIDYVYLILRLQKVLEAAQSSFGGSAGQQRVSKMYLKSIMIPYPDISIQKEIVDTVYSMKKKAKILQEESKCLMEKTKQEIENIILG